MASVCSSESILIGTAPFESLTLAADIILSNQPLNDVLKVSD